MGIEHTSHKEVIVPVPLNDKLSDALDIQRSQEKKDIMQQSVGARMQLISELDMMNVANVQNNINNI